jgi:ribosome biogenesis GTPase
MSTSRLGRVVAWFGKEWAVEDATGVFLAYPSARCQDLPCVGDWVEWEISNRYGRILKVLPRQSLLTRPGHGGSVRPVAANVEQILIVIAPEPPYDLLLVDQYLVVCELHFLSAGLIFNKLDLLPVTQRSALLEEDLAPYARLYPVMLVSAKTGEGIAQLRTALQGKVSLLAGQSGVGKSSLLQCLIPNLKVRIGELSAGTRRGRHTTTSARLFHLPEGGDLIDTPGVSIFGLAGVTPQKLALGFKEFREFIARCRFADCRHADDLGCAVREAAQAGKLSRARYQRYLKLLEKLPHIS